MNAILQAVSLFVLGLRASSIGSRLRGGEAKLITADDHIHSAQEPFILVVLVAFAGLDSEPWILVVLAVALSLFHYVSRPRGRGRMSFVWLVHDLSADEFSNTIEKAVVSIDAGERRSAREFSLSDGTQATVHEVVSLGSVCSSVTFEPPTPLGSHDVSALRPRTVEHLTLLRCPRKPRTIQLYMILATALFFAAAAAAAAAFGPFGVRMSELM